MHGDQSYSLHSNNFYHPIEVVLISVNGAIQIKTSTTAALKSECLLANDEKFNNWLLQKEKSFEVNQYRYATLWDSNNLYSSKGALSFDGTQAPMTVAVAR